MFQARRRLYRQLGRQCVTSATTEQSPPYFAQPNQMSAWRVDGYGSPTGLTLQAAVPRPVISKSSEVLVRVRAASLNPLDAAMIGGYGQVLLDAMRSTDLSPSVPFVGLPLTVGRDFCGEVVVKGVDARHLDVGDIVYGVVPPHKVGSHAEYVVTDSNLVRRKPTRLSDEEAASVLYAGLTAWSALTVTGDLWLMAKPKKMSALVLGGSGGVGIYAVQLLTHWGCRVVTTCAPDAVQLLQSLGPATVVDYTAPIAMRSLEEAGKFDLILDASGAALAATHLHLLREWSNAKFITLRSPLLANVDRLGLIGGMFRNAADLACANVTPAVLGRGVTSRWGYFLPLPAGVSEIDELITCGKVRPVVEKVFAYSDMLAAYERLAQGHLRGKLVVMMNGKM